MRRLVEFYFACISNEKGKVFSLFRSLFYVFSKIYYLLLKLHLFLYEKGILPREKLSATVISIGNITWGGTGKTPAVLMLARFLTEKGKRVCVLTRGYGRRRKGRSVAVGGNETGISAEELGDEPYLLVRNLVTVPVLVGKDRVRTARYAQERLACQFIILDDGFQYLRLERDLDIVVIDCLNPFGNGHLFPRGELREPVSHLRRSNIFLLTRTDLVTRQDVANLKRILTNMNPESLIVESIHRPLHLEGVFSKEKKNVGFVQNRDLVVFSSIGNPLSFEKTLEMLGGRIARSFRFPDHHRYREKDFEDIREAFGQQALRGRPIIVTTEKDSVRIADEMVGEILREAGEIWALKIELEIVGARDEWLRELQSYF